MAYSFNDEDKTVNEFKENIPFGKHEVQITGAMAEVTEAGKDYIAVGVVDVDGVEDEVRLWFTGGASNISFNTLRQVAVHCADDEEAKEAARNKVDACKDNDELAAVISELCSGKKVWYTKYYDATRTYQTENGTFRSINKNIYGYEPKLKPELMPKDTAPAKTAADLVGGEDVTGTDAAAGIPKDEDWAK